MSDIKASSTLVGFSSLILIVSTEPKKHNSSYDSVSDDQCNKRAHLGVKVEPIDDGGHQSNVNTRSAPPVTRCDAAPIKGGRE